MKRVLVISVVFLPLMMLSAGEEPRVAVTSTDWQRLWPAAVDSEDEAYVDGNGQPRSLTGPGAVDWFLYGSVGRWKEWIVKPGQALWIQATGDTCRGCVLGSLRFRILETSGADWKESLAFNGPRWSGSPPPDEPAKRFIRYVPKTGRIRIDATEGGFYITIFQEIPAAVHKPMDPAELHRIEQLMESLGAQQWSEREAAEQELRKIGAAAVPFLKENQNHDDPEIRLRTQELLAEFVPAIGTPTSSAQLRQEIDQLARALVDRLDINTAETQASLIAMGDAAVPALAARLNDPSVDRRLRAVEVLAQIKTAQAGALLETAAKDADAKVRAAAQAGLSSPR